MNLKRIPSNRFGLGVLADKYQILENYLSMCNNISIVMMENIYVFGSTDI